jgi:hypothetical protein
MQTLIEGISTLDGADGVGMDTKLCYYNIGNNCIQFRVAFIDLTYWKCVYLHYAKKKATT